MSDPVHESDRPSPASATLDPHKGWRPADDDDTAPAVAWRARHAHAGVRALRVDHEELRKAIKDLATNVGGLTGAVQAVKKLLLWALGIVGALALVGGARLAWGWLSSLHH